MHVLVRILALVMASAAVVLAVGAPLVAAAPVGMIAVGLALHGSGCRHARALLEPAGYEAGARRQASWYCPDCHRTWHDAGRSRLTSRRLAS